MLAFTIGLLATAGTMAFAEHKMAAPTWPPCCNAPDGNVCASTRTLQGCLTSCEMRCSSPQLSQCYEMCGWKFTQQ